MNPRIRRLAGPLAPALGRVRRRVRYELGRGIGPYDWAPPSLSGRLHRVRASGLRGISREDFLELKREYAYYRTRGRYLSVASHLVDELSAKYRLHTALELGPNLQPVAAGADVMDIVARDLRGHGKLVVADAMATWPFPDKAYDLFIALQVFEHLGTSQAIVFREMVRVARHAIISLPVGWVMDNPKDCHHGLTEERILGWFEPIKPTRIVEGNGGPKPRIIYVFENLPERLDPPPDAPATHESATAG